LSALVRKELDPVDINDYLTKRGYTPEDNQKLLEAEVLIFPSSKDVPDIDETGQYELLNPNTVILKKTLGRAVKTEIVTDKKREHRYLEHLSADIVLPFLVIFGPDIWEIVKGIISNWLYDRVRALSKGGKKPSARFEYEISDDKKKVRKHIVYEGPAEELAKILKETKD